jgi:hypothetical protein
MGPKRQTVQPRSQASPLADDILKRFQGMLDEGAFGTGVGPLQRSAGKAAEQFVNSGPTVAGSKFNLDELVSGLTAINKRQTDTSVGDLRESFGALGSRYGTPLAVGESNVRAQGNEQLLTNINQAYLQADQSDQNRRQIDLAGIQTLAGIGTQSINPFLQLGSQGILPEETTVSANPWLQFGSALVGGVSGVAAARARG